VPFEAFSAYFKNDLMKNTHFLCLFSFLCLFYVSLGQGQEQTVSERIIDLVKLQENEAAFSLAQEYAFELEGEARFDFAYGLAARANGFYHRAVFAFERVVFSLPSNIDARFALASTYFQVNNFSAAKTEFQRLLSQTLSQQMRSTIEDYLVAIERKLNNQKPRWSGGLQLGVGQDSNANNGVEDEFIEIPIIGQVLLFDESRQVESVYYDFNGRLTYVSPLSQKASWYASGSVSHVEFEDQIATSRTFLSTGLGYTRQFNQVSTNVSFFYRPLWLEEQRFLDYFGLSLNITIPINKALQIGLDGSYALEKYQDNEALDKDQISLNPFIHVIGSNTSSKFSLRYADDRAKTDINDLVSRELYGVGYRWLYQISKKWIANASGEYLKAEYDDINPLFDVFRDDEQTRVELGLDYVSSTSWKWKARFNHIDNGSTVTIFDYQRNKFWLGVEYVF
jgi:tetratricopeptide (TPR) repeat protein